jgi:hypothetical protein
MKNRRTTEKAETEISECPLDQQTSNRESFLL